MARKLFGTDGVRGVAGEFLTAELALALGRAAVLPHRRRARRACSIVRDTRESGEMLQAALAAGVASAGGEVAARRRAADAGRAAADRAATASTWRPCISASHNPYRDNGIKFFAGDGYKLSDETEQQIERDLERRRRAAAGGAIGRIRELRGSARGLPARACTRASPALDLDGRRRAAGLRERRNLPGRAGDLQAPGRARDGDRGRA